MKIEKSRLIFESTGRSIIDGLISVSDDPKFEIYEGYDSVCEAIKPESDWKEYDWIDKKGNIHTSIDQGESELNRQEKLELANHMIQVWMKVRDSMLG